MALKEIALTSYRLQLSVLVTVMMLCVTVCVAQVLRLMFLVLVYRWYLVVRCACLWSEVVTLSWSANVCVQVGLDVG